MEHRGYSKKKAFLASIPLLKRFQLGREEQLARAIPTPFSGGMRQRAMVAMGISAGARIIFADEPTKGLDQKRVDLVADTLNRLETEALLCVTHDLQFAAAVCRRVCVMYAAQQVEYGSAAQVLGQPPPLYPGHGAGYAGKQDACSGGLCSGDGVRQRLPVPGPLSLCPGAVRGHAAARCCQ